jgi:NitT/TauT family transport system ATP-binding protein
VLTSRPGRVKTVVDVDIDRTAEDIRSGEEFRALRHRIWSLLHDEVERAHSLELADISTTEEVQHV